MKYASVTHLHTRTNLHNLLLCTMRGIKSVQNPVAFLLRLVRNHRAHCFHLMQTSRDLICLRRDHFLLLLLRRLDRPAQDVSSMPIQRLELQLVQSMEFEELVNRIIACRRVRFVLDHISSADDDGDAFITCINSWGRIATRGQRRRRNGATVHVLR